MATNSKNDFSNTSFRTVFHLKNEEDISRVTNVIKSFIVDNKEAIAELLRYGLFTVPNDRGKISIIVSEILNRNDIPLCVQYRMCTNLIQDDFLAMIKYLEERDKFDIFLKKRCRILLTIVEWAKASQNQVILNRK